MRREERRARRVWLGTEERQRASGEGVWWVGLSISSGERSEHEVWEIEVWEIRK